MAVVGRAADGERRSLLTLAFAELALQDVSAALPAMGRVGKRHLFSSPSWEDEQGRRTRLVPITSCAKWLVCPLMVASGEEEKEKGFMSGK